MNGAAQSPDLVDIGRDPVMQTGIQHFIDRGVTQAGFKLGSQALGGPTVISRQTRQNQLQFDQTGPQRTRHISPQQQQLGNLCRAWRAAIDFGERLK